MDLWTALVSFDQICGQLVHELQGREPIVYGTILVVVLLAAFVSPPQNGSGQI